MAVVIYDYGTLPIEVYLFCNFAVVFSSTYIYPFPPSTDRLFGDFHDIRRCAPNRYCTSIVKCANTNTLSMLRASLLMAYRPRKKIHETYSEI
jgi:hypothetical protein